MLRIPKTHYNSPCLKCGSINDEMVRWGALIFCDDCFKTLLPGVNWETVDWNLLDQTQFNDLYSEWLQVYKEKY